MLSPESALVGITGESVAIGFSAASDSFPLAASVAAAVSAAGTTSVEVGSTSRTGAWLCGADAKVAAVASAGLSSMAAELTADLGSSASLFAASERAAGSCGWLPNEAAAAVMAAISSGVISGGSPAGTGRSNSCFGSTGLDSWSRHNSRTTELATCGISPSDSAALAGGGGMVRRFFHPVSVSPNESAEPDCSIAARALAKRPGFCGP